VIVWYIVFHITLLTVSAVSVCGPDRLLDNLWKAKAIYAWIRWRWPTFSPRLCMQNAKRVDKLVPYSNPCSWLLFKFGRVLHNLHHRALRLVVHYPYICLLKNVSPVYMPRGRDESCWLRFCVYTEL
jgi:hypothetical protein